MSDHPIDRYGRACDILDEKAKVVDDLARAVTACAAKLQNWKTLVIEDNYNKLGKGSRIATSRIGNHLDVSAYPAIEDIDRAFTEWREAAYEAQGAWQAMSQDQQKNAARRH